MSTLAKIGYGTTFYVGQTKIGDITDISGPSLARDSIDVTDMESADGFREKIPGLADGGEVSIEFNFDPAATSGTSQHALRENIEAGPNVANTEFTIKFVSGLEVEFSGHVTAFEPAIPLEDKMTGSVTIAVSGKPLWSNGSGGSGSGA